MQRGIVEYFNNVELMFWGYAIASDRVMVCAVVQVERNFDPAAITEHLTAKWVATLITSVCAVMSRRLTLWHTMQGTAAAFILLSIHVRHHHARIAGLHTEQHAKEG